MPLVFLKMINHAMIAKEHAMAAKELFRMFYGFTSRFVYVSVRGLQSCRPLRLAILMSTELMVYRDGEKFHPGLNKMELTNR